MKIFTSIVRLPWKSSTKLHIVESIVPYNLNFAVGLFSVLENNFSGVILKGSGLMSL